MKVWIVAKIHRREYFWIHGLTTENQNVRLLPQDGSSEHLPFEVGEIWDLSFRYAKPIFLPHLENRIVDTWRFIGKEPNLSSFLIGRVKLCKGGTNVLFNGSLKSGRRIEDLFIAEGMNLPAKSIDYWLLSGMQLCQTITSRSFSKTGSCKRQFAPSRRRTAPHRDRPS